MHVKRHVVTLGVNASGALTAYTDEAVMGRILAMRYIPDGTNPLDTGADLTITGEESGIPILAVSDIGTSAVNWAPRQATCGITGVASLYAGGGTAIQDHVAIAGERIKVVVAQGGVSKTGKLHILVG